ncbi:MAG: translation initiation factor IF-2 [Rickettsiaceae bacterium H1]|nr:translation initiation factor IF-2 [Rickettsiaceae bacterium H1]
MSNNKLSLSNLNLNKVDLEERIIAKLLKKDSTSTTAKVKIEEQQQDNLTKTEKVRRAKALLTLKSTEKSNTSAAIAAKSNIEKTPLVHIHNSSQEQESTKKDNYKKEEKQTKKEFIAKKINSDPVNKKYSKYNKVLTNDEDSNIVRKKPKQQIKTEKKIIRKITIRSAMTIHEISARIFEPKNKIIEVIKNLDDSINIEKPIEPEIVELIAQELGHTAEIKLKHSIAELTNDDTDDDVKSLEKRPPIITIMGHVDHGKTTLIDALRQSNITDTEHGGITQHIGAYQIGNSNEDLITIIDTPGHAAFTAMRARGAKITDIAVLVIAADDSIKEQTVEAINHIQAAKVPIIVAINKIDKQEANPKRVMNELLQYNVIAEDLGGDVLTVEVSAKNKLNLDKLKEAILLQAELLEIKANKNKNAKGIVLEAQLDKKRGVSATLIVESGILKKGDIVIAGSAYCKIRAMTDCNEKSIKEALPATPIEVLGFDDAPVSGEQFITLNNEKDAKAVIEVRSRNNNQIEVLQDDLHDLFQDEKQQISFVIKGDTNGSIEAISDSINKLQINILDINLLHKAVGAITESDILLASASGASIISFCIKEDKKISDLAKKHKVTIRHYSIIYNLINDIKSIVSGLLPSINEEKNIGNAVIREIFNITKIGKVAGCYVQDGMIKKEIHARLIRDSKVVYEGKINTLRRFKKDAKEVKNGFECGISLENYSDIKVGDVIESFEIIKTKQSL